MSKLTSGSDPQNTNFSNVNPNVVNPNQGFVNPNQGFVDSNPFNHNISVPNTNIPQNFQNQGYGGVNPTINSQSQFPGVSPGFNTGVNPSFNSGLNPNINNQSQFPGVSPGFNTGVNPSFNSGFNPNLNNQSQFSGVNPGFNTGVNPSFNSGFNNQIPSSNQMFTGFSGTVTNPNFPGGKMVGVPGCQKCNGTGFKISKKSGGKQKPCKSCSSSLGFCSKCNNTGFKVKDGKQKPCKCKGGKKKK